MTRTGQFSETVMRAALDEIVQQIGVSAQDARLLHMFNNAVYALPGAGVVIRITRSRAMDDRVHKVARLGVWFDTVDAPAIRLSPHHPQPFTTSTGLLATVWTFLTPSSHPTTVADLGAVLREWHALPAPSQALPAWDPVGAARNRIRDAEGLDLAARNYLLNWCQDLEPRIAELNRKYPATVIHGDAHAGNLLRRRDGRIVLCDFDSTSIGPPQVDLAAIATAELWFDRQGEHEALVEAYGLDVTSDPDWPTYRSARELAFLAGGVPILKSTPGAAAEFARRLRSVQRGAVSTRWTPYSHLTQAVVP